MDLATFRQKVNTALKEDNATMALAYFEQYLKPDSALSNAISLLQARDNRIKNDLKAGMVTRSVAGVERNNLNDSIKAYLEEVEIEMLTTKIIPAKASSPLINNSDLSDQERQGIERVISLKVKIINKLREKLSLEDDPIREVRYEEQLLQVEQELTELKNKLV